MIVSYKSFIHSVPTHRTVSIVNDGGLLRADIPAKWKLQLWLQRLEAIENVLFYKLWLEFYRLPEADVTCPRALTWISQKHVTKEVGAEHNCGKGNGGHLSPHSYLGSTEQNQTSMVCLFDSRTLPPPFLHKVAKRDFRGQSGIWPNSKCDEILTFTILSIWRESIEKVATKGGGVVIRLWDT